VRKREEGVFFFCSPFLLLPFSSAFAHSPPLPIQTTTSYLGDKKGRKSMYLLTLIIMITATIGQASSASAVRGFSFAVWLVIWRFMLGFGIGGDYPVSLSLRKRETRERGT
jgi:MFS family permease